MKKSGQPFHRCPQRYGMIYLFDKLELVGARPLYLAAASLHKREVVSFFTIISLKLVLLSH